MRILCIYKHYWPDVTPYARLLKAIAEHLVSEGHEVTVFSAQPCYNDFVAEDCPSRQTEGGVRIIRTAVPRERKTNIPLRLLAYSVFLAKAVLHAVRNRRRYDLTLFNMHPPVLMGVAGRAIKRLTGIPYVAHCQDIHPESARQNGKFKNELLYRCLRSVDMRTCHQAKLNVVLSDDMRQTLRDRGVGDDRIMTLNNFSLTRHHETTQQELDALPPEFRNKFVVLFAGNLGNFQGLDHLVDAALLLRDHDDIRFLFMGAGAARARLLQKTEGTLGNSIAFLPYQPLPVAFAAMQQASLGVVSLLPGHLRMAYPSKTMTYLAAGCPVLALVDQDSELARTVYCKQLGYTCDQGNAEEIAQIIERAWQARSAWTAGRRAQIRQQADQLFGREQALRKWATLIEDLSTGEQSHAKRQAA